MAAAKTSTLTLRIEPAFKNALRVAAEGEHRSISNMVEVLIRDYCRVHGIRIPDASATSSSDAPASGKGKGPVRGPTTT